MTGLAVLAVGCLLFWPSGVKRSFGGFCGSMFVVGAGLSTLETAADPFLSICGPPRYSEIRLNLAQAVQGVGSFVAPLLASRVFFAHTGRPLALSTHPLQRLLTRGGEQSIPARDSRTFNGRIWALPASSAFYLLSSSSLRSRKSPSVAVAAKRSCVANMVN